MDTRKTESALNRQERIVHSVLITGIILIVLAGCRTASQWTATKRDIRHELSKEDGKFAVAFKDLSTGETLMMHADEMFHAASTMKTPVMIQVFRDVAEGKLLLTDSITVKNTFHSVVDGSNFSLIVNADSEPELFNDLGRKRTVRDLVYVMITQSSNLATNILIERVGADNVTRTMRDLGASRIEVRRGVEDSVAFARGVVNRTSARDLLVIFESIAGGKVVSREACDEMITILLATKSNTVIPARLPQDVKVAHKTGNITGVRHDSGIVLLPDGRRYVIVILSRDLSDDAKATAAMATVSRIVYNQMVKAK